MDDQRLKEMLSAWFDGELGPEESALVEAYIDRSEEARQIVARLEALKDLSDASVLNPNSDYWDRSAARIEVALGEAASTTITPLKRSTWSEYGWKAVSLAASVILLTYVGFHSEEIFGPFVDQPRIESLTPEKVIEEKSDEPQVDGRTREQELDTTAIQSIERDDLKDYNKPENSPKPAASSEAKKEARREAVPTEVALPDVDQLEETSPIIPPIEKEDEASLADDKRGVSKTGRQRSGVRTLGRNEGDLATKPLAPTPGLIVDSVGPEAGEIELLSDGVIEMPKDITERLEEDGERLTSYDSTSAEATEEEWATYYWNHVILVQQEAKKGIAPVMEFDGGANYLLSNSLDDSADRSSKSSKKSKKQEREARKKALEEERKVIDAAFYMGQKAEKRATALKYLKYMATKNDETLDRAYANKKFEELKKLQ